MDTTEWQADVMNAAVAFDRARQAMRTIVTLQPMDGVAVTSGAALTVRQLDGSAVRFQFQHVVGGTMRVVRTELEGLQEVGRTVTPLDTDVVVTDYIRAMVVEVLR